MSNTIRETLLAQAPKFSADYVEYFTNFYNNNVEELGRRWLSNAYDGRRDRWNHVIVRCFDGDMKNLRTEMGAFNPAKLQKLADEYGEQMATKWANKLECKLENVEGVEMRNAGRGSFTFTGRREGKAIRVEQQTVTKVSNRGTWFHQFPARIYVDGKFTSEKAYKEMFATVADKAAAPQSHRETFTADAAGRALHKAYDRQRELKAEGIRSRVTGDARYATITFKK